MRKYTQKLGQYFLAVLVLIDVSMAHAQTWNELVNPTVGAEEVNRIYAIEGHATGVYLCTNLGVFRTIDNGGSFTNLSYISGVTANLPIQCLFIDDSDGAMYIGGEDAVFKSSDNGSSWDTTSITGVPIINDIDRAADNIVVAYGTFAGGGVYFSGDGLVTYQTATGLPDLEMLDLLPYNSKMFLAGDEGMYSSSDGGENWALQGIGHPIDGRYNKTVALDGNLFSGDINGKGLFKSSDNGDTWASTNPITFMDFCQVFDLESGSGIVLALTDGVNCNPQNIPIRYSDDNGVNWQSGMGNLPQAFYNELGRNAEGTCFYMYAPFERKLYTTCDLLGATEIAMDNIVLTPNPTSGRISIAGMENGSVIIYNAQGLIVKKFTNVSANNILDIFEVSVGMYFIKVLTERESKTFKLIKK